jgi:hypothetical protein
MNQPKPPVIGSKALFQRYWKNFLLFWSFPLLLMAGQLIQDFVGTGALRTVTTVISFIDFFIGLAIASITYMRRELSWSQTIMLGSPFMGVWILLVIVRGIIFTLIGRPL